MNDTSDSTIVRDFTNSFGIAKIAGIILIFVAVMFGGWLIYILKRSLTDHHRLYCFSIYHNLVLT
mgnify:CR=1 FL=1